MKHGCPNIGFWFVDVRDAAKAHIMLVLPIMLKVGTFFWS